MMKCIVLSHRAAAFLVVLLAAATVPHPAGAAKPIYEEPPISYSTAAPQDRVARLKEAIDAGRTELPYDPQRGYLDGLLRELQIPPSSQSLVFSKTSLQRTKISPRNPRAIYFNDDTYVGYVPGGKVIEIASTDPKLGTTFYVIEQSPPAARGAATARATIDRQTESCLQCHGDSMTRGVPGLLVRSVYPDAGGNPILRAGTFLTTHQSPIEERWGGWYVTGSTGGQPHLGNATWQERQSSDSQPLETSAPRRAELPAGVRGADYLTPHSDVVALMVLEHQVEAHNRITRAAHGTLRALRDEKIINDALGQSLAPGEHSESTLGRIRSSCEPLVEYLLFAKEAPLTDTITGDSPFVGEFSARGPRDAKGRSLRDFDLKTRLFRYPCSYLIDSSALNELPAEARRYVYRRLWEILSGREAGESFVHLSEADRAAITEILRETKADLREVWEALDAREAREKAE